MVNFKSKNILSMLISVISMLCLMCGIEVSAEEYQGKIFDDYNVLTEQQIHDLNSILNENAQTLQINIGAVITDQTDRDNAIDFTDIYLENVFGKNSNSILYLINTYDDYDYISTSGTAIQYYSDDTISYILQCTSGMYLLEDNMDYYGAISEFADLTISEQHQQGGKFSVLLLIISIIVGLVASIIICFKISDKYNNKVQTSADIYAKSNDGNINFTNREDIFIRTYTTKEAIPHDDDTSSTHTSSSGGTHGGGGFQR